VLSVAISGVVGWGMLLAVTAAIGDLSAAASADNPFIFVLETALGERLGGALVWVVMGAMWFCGLSSVTSNSRMLFAFARDGGLPGSSFVSRVSPRYRSPHVAVWTSTAAAFVVAIWSDAYAVMVALSTIALYASYAVPVVLHMRRRSSGETKRGPWHLGRHSAWINAVAVAWVGIVMVLFVLPPNQLAGYTFAGALAALAVYWFGFMRARFRGPQALASARAPG
jgi:amino acid transporter